MSDTSGVLTYDYVVEVDAIPDGPTQTGNAVFRVKLSSFKPARDLPGQKENMWYLQGVWTIEPASANTSGSEKRHDLVHYRGMLNSALAYDPLQTPDGELTADIDIPTSLVDNGWLSASGSFSGDSSFRGSINLDIDKPAQARLTYGQEVKP